MNSNRCGTIEPEEIKCSSDNLSVLKIKDTEFSRIRELIHDNFGINLSTKKKMLVVGRLQGYVKEKNYTSFDEYISHLESDKSGVSLSDLINRISTNYTYFFRENVHFEFLSRVALPQIIEKLVLEKNRDLRVWSAGCSSGDEAYSLLITIQEFLGEDYKKWDAGLLATDISEIVLDEARRGEYPEKRIGKLTADIVRKYFLRRDNGIYQIKRELREEVTFRRFNLVNEKFPFKKKFELIFCRNVMIYFDRETRERLVGKLYDLTADGGYLFVGHAESLNKLNCSYTLVQPGVYRKGGADA